MPSRRRRLVEFFSGWILDARETATGVSFWVKGTSGEVRPFRMRLSPSFYLAGQEGRLRRAAQLLEGKGARVSFEEKREFFSGRQVLALKVEAPSPRAFRFLVRVAENLAGGESLYSSDLPVEELFFIQTGAFPLGKVEVEADGAGEARALSPLEENWALDYSLPPLTVAEVRPVGRKGVSPSHQPWVSLEVSCEGETFELRWEEGEEFIRSFRSLLLSFDPDLIVSEWGDEFLFPRLLEISRLTGIPTGLSREGAPEAVRGGGRGRSFFSYGRIIYRAGRASFPGRIHLDRRNSFLFGEVGLEGLVELTRLSRLSLERVCRASPGTIISAMEVERALRQGILVPSRKRQVEQFRDAASLVEADKGGLVYAPPLGVFEEVAEFDFASMYPTIMAKNNISPETLDCPCCGGPAIPETGTRTCRKRRGLIPEVLEPILERRRVLKRRAREAASPGESKVFTARQTALKWILVVSFGFLGYRNARFGKIEAHEAVTALGRDALLTAKEVAEREGFSFLHGLTDALWVKKEGASLEEYEALGRRMSEAAGLEVALEGVYRWIAFLPSKTRPGVPVPSRFVGLFRGGEVKVRGLACRRRDTPPLAKRMQEEMLQVLSGCRDRRELAQAGELLEEIYRAYREDLLSGLVPPEELAVVRRLSKPASAYGENTAAAWAVRELLGRGVNLPPGEKIAFVLTSTGGKGEVPKARSLGFFSPDDSVDLEKYEELLRRAAEEILQVVSMAG
ncbi:MAG: hypothetical protein D6713_07575 [Deltaproteobacteria bacterium]|nr:MAG: hypothetical protein D6713_07575 [Deltaproteobacteria bacterium]